MRLLTGVVLAAGVLAGAILLFPTISGFILAPGFFVVISEISSGIISTAVWISGFLLKHLPEILFAGAALIVLNSIRKYPPKLFTALTTRKEIELDQPIVSSNTAVLIEDFDFTPLSHLEDPNSRIDTSIQQSLGSELDSGSDFQPDAITEARVFERFGMNPQAISLLMEKFTVEEENLDEIALELSSLFEEEIENRFDNDEDATDLFVQRNQFLELVSRRSPLLSGEVWFRLCEQYPHDLIEPNSLDKLHSKRLAGVG